jgi:two-component system, chemotaxis family, response regulator Rcp1
MQASNPSLFRPIDILLVEDNPGDRRLTIEALKDGKVKNRIWEVEDGIQALAFLRQEGEYSDVPRPDIIFLDLNMPGLDGREVLAKIKVDESLRRIPVMILTTSDEESDVFTSYDLHANCYITKPLELDAFFDAVKSIEHFWVSIVALPEN